MVVKPRRLRTRRGVFVLPALFTVSSIFLGVFSIVRSISGDPGAAALAIGFAILADLVDGRVARFAAATSDFGRELDSLADMCSFGVAPAVLAYTWALHRWDQTGWLVAALFVVCAAIRLARFNVGRLDSDPRFYVGLPSPAAAAVIGAVVYAWPSVPSGEAAAVAALGGVLALALLMNSPVRFLSFKALTGRRAHSHRTLVVVAAFIVAAVAEPVIMFLFLAGGYALHPLVRFLVRLPGRRRRAGLEPAKESPRS